MRMLTIITVVGLSSSVAVADGSKLTQRADRHVPVAIGVNFPTGWFGASSLAATLSVGVTNHVAIRTNIARYEPGYGRDLLATPDGDGVITHGRVLDVGASAVLYVNKPFMGWFVEAGLLVRSRDHREDREQDSPAQIVTDTTTYAGRAYVGYSLLVRDRAFVALGVGASLGYERGVVQTDDERGTMPTVETISRRTIAPEAYLRFGIVFDVL